MDYSAQGNNFRNRSRHGPPHHRQYGRKQCRSSGMSNGIFLTARVQGNIDSSEILSSAILPCKSRSTHPSNSGVDIKNLADVGANTFEGNVCVTSINAPCPSTGPSFTASPNPIPVTGAATLGVTTLSWSAPDADVIEIHVGSPNGPLFTQMGTRGSIQTGLWVSDGLTFYLQDVTGGKPLTSDYTLATLVVHLQKSGSAYFDFRGGPRWWGGAMAALLGLGLCWVWLGWSGARWNRLCVVLRHAALFAGIVFSLSQIGCGPNSTFATTDGRHTGPNDRRPQKPAGTCPVCVWHSRLQEVPHHGQSGQAGLYGGRQAKGPGL